jgi:hypothetical protein
MHNLGVNWTLHVLFRGRPTCNVGHYDAVILFHACGGVIGCQPLRWNFTYIRLVRLTRSLNCSLSYGSLLLSHGNHFQQTIHVQLQTGSDLLFSVKTIGKNNTTHDKFVVKATYIESTDLPCSLVRYLCLHFIHYLLELRWVLGEGQFQGIIPSSSSLTLKSSKTIRKKN